MKYRSSAGFTLVELLVVVAVVGILAAFLLPIFARAREVARRTACASNIRQIGMALLAYVDDYDGHYPQPSLTGGVEDDEENEEEEVAEEGPMDWDEVIQPYLKSEPIFRCPSDPSPPEFYDFSYTLNGSFANGLSTAAISYPSETVLAADRRSSFDNQDAPPVFLWWQWQSGIWPPRLLPDPSPKATWDLALERHGDRLNFLFADGHVRALPFKATWGADRANQYWPERP